MNFELDLYLTYYLGQIIVIDMVFIFSWSKET